jgi:hypothetical protein
MVLLKVALEYNVRASANETACAANSGGVRYRQTKAFKVDLM